MAATADETVGNRARTLVLGIGNALLTGEGAGLHVLAHPETHHRLLRV